MKDPKEQQIICPHCGQPRPIAAGVCPNCGVTGEPDELHQDAAGDWARTRDSLKTRWVVSVMAFWVSAAVLLAVFVIEGNLNLVLVSIVLGMLIVGVWLKSRYQMHLRKDPNRH